MTDASAISAIVRFRHGTLPRPTGGPRRELRHREMVANDALLQPLVGSWKHVVDGRPDDGDRPAPQVDRLRVGDRIDPATA